MRSLFLILLLMGSAGAAAAEGALYVTGSQYYEGCWQRRAKEKATESNFKDVEADNPSQAALWASCTRIVAETMDKIGFAIGSSRADAIAEAKVLAASCPDRYTEIPVLIDRLYIVVIDAIEKLGGPSTVESYAPASWVIERALKARWPKCIDAARPYIAKAKAGN